MPSDATEPPIEPDDQEQLRAEVREVMRVDGLSVTDTARAVGMPYGTFSNWIGGTYGGRGERIAEQVQRWLSSREQQAKAQALAPRAPAFVATPTAEQFLAALEHAQYLPELIVITGAPGVGKTSACRAHQARATKVFMVTGEPTMSTPRALLDEVADAISVSARGLSSQQLSRAIAKRLRGTGSLLIIDEAQHLPSQVLDQLRTIHDLAEVGIALVGNETVFGKLEGGTRSAHYAQLYSRVGMRVSRQRPTKRDIDQLLDAWSIADKPARAMLHVIASKPGALRNLTKVLRVAHMTAGAEGGEAVGEKHVRLAWETLGARDAPPARAA